MLLVLVIFSYISQLFSTAGMLWLVTLLAFSVPKLYLSRKDTVDEQLSSIKGQLTGFKKQAFAKIPRASSVKDE